MTYIDLLIRTVCQVIAASVPEQQADAAIANIRAAIERSNRMMRGEVN